jgi:hypothetical protein
MRVAGEPAEGHDLQARLGAVLEERQRLLDLADAGAGVEDAQEVGLLEERPPLAVAVGEAPVDPARGGEAAQSLVEPPEVAEEAGFQGVCRGALQEVAGAVFERAPRPLEGRLGGLEVAEDAKGASPRGECRAAEVPGERGRDAERLAGDRERQVGQPDRLARRDRGEEARLGQDVLEETPGLEPPVVLDEEEPPVLGHAVELVPQVGSALLLAMEARLRRRHGGGQPREHLVIGVVGGALLGGRRS